MISDEAWKALTIIIPSTTTILAGLFYRMWSRSEHKGNRDDVREIRLYINGQREKELKEAYERGVKDTEEKNK